MEFAEERGLIGGEKAARPKGKSGTEKAATELGIYREFIEHIEPHVRADNSGEKEVEWNDVVFEFFMKLGKRRGCTVETNWKVQEKFNKGYFDSWRKEYQSRPHEYLADLCGWKREGNKYWLDFIVEVEWLPQRPTEDLDEDFYKLLDIKAHTKIGVGGCSLEGEKQLRRDEVGQLLDMVSRLIQNSPWETKNENYLFIFMDNFSEHGAGVSGHLLSGDGKARRELAFHEYCSF